MTNSLAVEQSRVVPVGVEEAFARTLPVPLPAIINRWYGPVPPVSRVSDQVGDWGIPGQTRRIVMKGGGGFDEELTKVDPPHTFGYALTGITGPLGLLIGRAEGEWAFAGSADTTTITWRWVVQPRSALTAPLLPVVAFLWKGYARQTLETLSTLLTS
jgi:hypothetical protein